VARISSKRTNRKQAKRTMVTTMANVLGVQKGVQISVRRGRTDRRAQLRVCARKPKAVEPESTENVGKYIAAGAGGTLAAGVCAWSTFTLKTTGCGLPPGPGGALGALEGVSFLALLGVVGWSAYTKVKTGKGLPAGPYGLLGAAEGLSYLVLLAYIVVLGINYVQLGYIPGAVPDDNCFG